jgi:hypothetical protein
MPSGGARASSGGPAGHAGETSASARISAPSRPGEESRSLPALANVPASPSQPASPSGRVATPPPARTLTEQLRAIQPPDVARQALRELDVLARELATVPDALRQAGLARAQRRPYFEIAHDYLELSERAWEAVAEEQLEQIGAEPAYRQCAIAVARPLTRLQHQARLAAQAPGAGGHSTARRPWQWRARVALVREGLHAWQAQLDAPADPLCMGQGLYVLRGSLTLAGAGGIELAALRALTGLALLLAPLLAVGLGLAAIGTLTAGASAARLGDATLCVVLLWVLALVLTTFGRARLSFLLAATCRAPLRSSTNGRAGSGLAAGLLRGWWWALSLGGVVATLVALGLAISPEITRGLPTTPGDALGWAVLAGQVLARAVAPAALVSLAAIFVLSLPVLALTSLRFAAELSGNVTWVPAARRYALAPALTALAFVTAALLVAVYVAATALGWDATPLLTLDLGGGIHIAPTLRAVALLLALTLPYALLWELSYRLGIRRWRAETLQDLATRRADLESHIRRLSATNPRTGAQNTSDDNLRAMQYDMTLLDFYRAKDAEARLVSPAPQGVLGPLVALILALLVALAVDGAGHWLTLLKP